VDDAVADIYEINSLYQDLEEALGDWDKAYNQPNQMMSNRVRGEVIEKIRETTLKIGGITARWI